jgi:uncharacterized membrane protein YfcA
MSSYLIAAPLGACVGVVLGLTGAGGAVLSVPLLTLVIGLPLVEAAPIGLLAVTLSAGLGAAIALHQGMLRYRAAMLMATAGALASPFGITLAYRVPERLLTALFSLLLLWIGVNTWRQARMPAEARNAAREPPCRINPNTGRFLWTLPCARVMAGSGLAAGFLSGLLGVGGGFIIIPALRRYTDLPMNASVATSMGVLTLVSAMGVAVSIAHAPLNLVVGTPFIGGAVAGMLLGRHWSARLSGANLQKSFALLCLGVAAAMAWSLARMAF